MQIVLNNLEITFKELKNIMNDLKVKAMELYPNLTNAYELVALEMQYLTAAKLYLGISAKEYANEIMNYNNWCQIEEDCFSSQIKLLEAKREAVLKRAEWNTFTGTGKSLS